VWPENQNAVNVDYLPGAGGMKIILFNMQILIKV